jgi:hypothetical protein
MFIAVFGVSLFAAMQLVTQTAMIKAMNPKSMPSLSQEKIAGCELAFFYWMYKKEQEGRASLRSVRKFHPNAPIYILGDQGGVNYTDFCMMLEVKYPTGKCKYVMARTKLGHDFNNGTETIKSFAHVDGRIREFFHHMERAVDWSKAKYLIRMQEDVRVLAKIETPTDADAAIAGLHNTWTGTMPETLMNFFQEESPTQMAPAWPHIACLGYIRSSAVMNMAHNYLHKADWYKFMEMYKSEGDSGRLSDDTVVLLLGSLAGEQIWYWDQICEPIGTDCCGERVAIVHKPNWKCSKHSHSLKRIVADVKTAATEGIRR